MQTQIQLLPEHIIDQIKAGEVIERPSTLIKEILENAIDAGATKLELHIIDNGLELISLIDNGKGIRADELPLAFCRHATSKIHKFEDIYHLRSYGFRGEALASIASVSKVSCESTTPLDYGQIQIEGGEPINHYKEEKKGVTTGTKIFIKDLFFNTPVRMKFIQSKGSEKNHIKKMVHSFLLNHFDKDFSVKWDQKEKEIYPARETRAERIKDVLFAHQEVTFERIESSYDGTHVELYLTHHSARGNSHKSHYLFVNQRYIKELPLHKVILNSAAPLWPEGETGHYVCFVNIPADEIDVNVHPNKTVVKFFRMSKVLSVISGSIKAKLTPRQFHAPSREQQSELLRSHNAQLTGQPEREIHYRTANFNFEDDTQSYFENIHHESPEKQTHHQILHQEGDFIFLKFNERLYVTHSKKLFEEHIKHLLKTIDLQNVSPLLVSKPLNLNKIPSQSQLEKATAFGFEVDAIDQNTFVARTFYFPLQIYPYLNILESLLNNDFNLEKISIDKTWGEILLSPSLFKEIFEDLRMQTLVEKSLLKQIQSKDLKSWYES